MPHTARQLRTTKSPGCDVGDAGADRLDDPRRLVAEEEGEVVVDATLPVVEIGVADAARLHLHERFARPGVGHRDRLDRDRLLLRLRDHCPHFVRHGRRVASRRVSTGVEARPRASASRRSRVSPVHPAAVVLAVAIGLWILTFGILVWRRQAYFGTIDFDLGIHDQSIWLLSRGHWFTTVRGLPVFGHHATFGYFLLVPFYWLGAGPQFINLLQVAALALGAIPIYLLARDRLVSPWAALIPALVWLLQPLGAVVRLGDLPSRRSSRSVPVLCAYLAAERNKIGWYWIWLALAIVWKEDLALLFIGLGLLYLIRRRWRLGAATIAVGTLWFAAFAMVMVPHLAGGQTVYGPLYGDLGDSPSEVARTAVTDPGAVASRLKQNGSGSYAVQLMAPMAFTPLAAPGLLLLGAPQAIVNLLSHRELHVGRAVPLHGAPRRRARPRHGRRDRRDRSPVPAAAATTIAASWVVLGVTLAMALFATRAWGPSPVSWRYHDGYWPIGPAADSVAKSHAVAMIPTGAAVSADYNLVPHLAHRELVYTFPNPWLSSNYGIGGKSEHANPADVEWIAVNTNVLDVASRGLLDELVGRGEFVVDSYDADVLVAHRVKPPG